MIEPEALIAEAKKYLGEFPLPNDGEAGSVAAALVSTSGRIYTGVCIDVSSGIGFCAEHSAIAEMLKHRETAIEMVVAVGEDGILPPCGRCREFMLLLDEHNAQTRVILGPKTIKPLQELMPYHWLNGEV